MPANNDGQNVRITTMVERVREGRGCPIHKSAICTRRYSSKDNFYHVYCPECGGLVGGYNKTTGVWF